MGYNTSSDARHQTEIYSSRTLMWNACFDQRMNPNGREETTNRMIPWPGRSLVPTSFPQAEVARSKKAQVEFGLDFTRFPSTRYQGSKRKIIPWIWSKIVDLDFSSALDIFGGTGSVSYLLKKMGKSTTYNDYLRFNHQIGRALIENDDVVLTQQDIDAVLSPQRQKHPTFVRDTFRGVYFTDLENEWIDRTVARISEFGTSPFKQALMYYALFQSCLVKRPFNLFHRRNLYVRLATAKRDFGNKTTWERPFEKVFAAFCAEANEFVFKSGKRCRAICNDALDVPRASYDLVYIDAPYLRRGQFNDSYLSYYHFLEGLCRYKDWASLIDPQTANLRMKDARKDGWADSKERSSLLDALFEKYRGSVLVVSYKRFGVPGIETLVSMLRRHGRKVRTHSRHYKYALNHQNGSADLNREVLLIAD